MKTFLAAIALVLLVCGCAPTTGTNREYDIPVTVSSNTGTVNITLEMKVDATSAAEQTSSPVISPTTRMQLTEGGSTAAGEASTLQDVASTLRQKLNSENTTTTTTTNYAKNEDNVEQGENVGQEVDQGKEEQSEDIEYTHKATYTSYGVRNGGRQAWRIDKKGPEFGQPIKIVFANGQTFIVEDTSHNYRESSGDRKGFVFKPGIGPNGEGDDNTGTSHGGVYLHAPYGNSSKTATFYYKKP